MSPSPFKKGPFERRRLYLTALFLSPFILSSLMFTAHGYRVLIRAFVNLPPGSPYATITDFPLRDSLPALEGGLSNLEAFKVTMSPSWRANSDRSLWVSDSIGSISVEFVSERRSLDSVSLSIWTDEKPLTVRMYRGTRDLSWKLKVNRAVPDWAEVVAVYQSYPPLLPFRSLDPDVTAFTEVEGKVFHVVAGWYKDRKEKPLVPDTSYAVGSTGYATEPLQLLTRGNAVAVVNGTNRPVRLRVLGLGRKGSVILSVDSSHVSIYRTLLTGPTRNALAYTDPGVTFPVFRAATAEPPRFFTLVR